MKKLVKDRSELLSILLIVVICLVIGAMTARDSGVSWDETNIRAYADYALRAYRYFLHPQDLRAFPTNLNLYGPAYFMVVDVFVRLIEAIHPAWTDVMLWHLCYFLTFLTGAVLLYLLARRSLSAAASLGAFLVFLTQPLLWGHAFINPKDLPFMVFFLASVYLGLEMVDRYLAARPNYALVAGAAIALGLTISIRSAGPLAGAIVGAYAIFKSPRKAILLLSVYFVGALITTYLTWPFLWGAPINKFLTSLKTMSDFRFDRAVRFMGRDYLSEELPWFYYPFLLGIQLTVPALLLAVGGLGLATWRFLRDHEPLREPLGLFVGWFLLPVIAILVLHSKLYDNARQLFFLLPPIFLLAGAGLEGLTRLFRQRWPMVGAIILCVVTGVYASIQLHPYEYIYYNQFVGGTGGAYRQYEMDYWATSYTEVAQWLDRNAPANSTLWVGAPAGLMRPYLRSDLMLTCTGEVDCGKHYDYVVLLARWNVEASCSRANTVMTIGRQGAVFAVIKQLAPGELCG